ncbi:unnamed protein product [Closterium sp. Yama58-4]|nr:unnamed protein product [Closterium sp. Yama58-4]
MASDRFNISSQLEHMQARYVGTGHADTTKYEWAVNIHRDSYASYVGHHPLLAFFAVAENESIGRERYNFMQVKGGRGGAVAGASNYHCSIVACERYNFMQVNGGEKVGGGGGVRGVGEEGGGESESDAGQVSTMGHRARAIQVHVGERGV